MELNNKEITISDGERPFWQTIVAAFFYTITLVLIGFFLFLIIKADPFSRGHSKDLTSFIYGIVFFFMGGLNFSMVTSIFFDLEKEKMKVQYRVGPFKVNRFSEIPELKYVSVFKKEENSYLVNLWYKGNKHFEIVEFGEFDPALEFGKTFSDRLKLDLLDATEKGNSKWIENE